MLSGRHVVTSLIAFLGAALVATPLRIGSANVAGALWGLLSGFTFALLSLLNKAYSARYPSLVIAFYQDASATLLLVPLLLVIQTPCTGRDLALLAALGLLCTAGGHTLFIHGLRQVSAQTASVIASLEPVYGILLAALFLGQIPTLRVLSGGALVLSAALYVTVNRFQKNN